LRGGALLLEPAQSMRTFLHVTCVAWGVGVLLLVGCGGAQPAPESAVERTPSPGVLPYLPSGAVAYGRLDLARLRESPHAARVIGWYRQFVPAIPGFEADDPNVRRIEDLLARTHDVAGAVYAPREVLVAAGDGDSSAPVEMLGDDEGAVVVLRTEVDLDWVERWAAESGMELVRRSQDGHARLVTLDPSAEQVVVTELDRGLLAVGLGRLESVNLRIQAMRKRVADGATELADADVRALAQASGAGHAPMGVLARVPPSVAANIAEDMEGAFEASDVAAVRGFALRVDPSDALVIDALLRTTAPDRAAALSRAIGVEAERHADNAFVLLLGLDLWLERSETRADGADVRATMHLSPEDLRMWFFHVERLAAAAKAFFTQGGLGGLFGGLMSDGGGVTMPPPIEAPPPEETTPPDEAATPGEAATPEEAPPAGRPSR
jgi:hypothetical protein